MELSETRESPDMSNSIDGFTHILPEMAMSSSISSKSQYSQVVFHDLPDVWPTDGDMVCTYSLTDNVLPQYGDKIALFKVGWSMVSEYITFQRVPTDLTKRERLSVTFKAETLPKDDKEIYQLCYVTSGNVIAGASTAFCFHKPNENELMGVEDPFNPGLVVFKSRVACLQSELKKKVEANELLNIRYELLENNFAILQKEIMKSEEEIRTQKQIVAELLEDKKEKESVHLKFEEEVRAQQQKISDLIKENEEQKKALEEQLNTKQNEYKINKEFAMLEALTMKENELTNYVTVLKAEKKDLEERLCNLQIREQSKSSKEKQFTKALNLISEENKTLKEEKDKVLQELLENKQKLLSLISTLRCLEEDKAHSDKRTEEIVRLNKQLETESEEIKNKHEFLTKILTIKENQLTKMENEVKTTKESLKETQDALEKNKSEMNSLHLQLNTKDLALQGHLKEIARLKDQTPAVCEDEDVEVLRVKLVTLQAHHEICEERIKCLVNQLDCMQLDYENEIGVLSIQNDENKAKIKQLEETIASMVKENENNKNSFEASLTDKLLKVKEEKASLSSELVQVRHENKELERALQEAKEGNAALKSRTKVLEYELGTLRSNNSQAPKPSSEALFHQLELFNKNMPNIITLNSFIAEQALIFKGNLEKEREEKMFLQYKIENLLKSDTEMCQKYKEMEMKYNAASLQNSRSLSSESDQLEKVLSEKQELEVQVMELRKNLMGTISVGFTKDLHQQIDSLKAEIAQKDERILNLEKAVFSASL
ncbi:tax1-binding protein 1 homolog B-like [Cimex lectularius]|uniref:SKICH domain-containing protein n=1 Tax=Cimex lectularius TaxID=79782 RepID=A0A8I6RIJ2_CIMLE|nr:tax1-binding protein 1 homolog B-like [Cimex lectularius]